MSELIKQNLTKIRHKHRQILIRTWGQKDVRINVRINKHNNSDKYIQLFLGKKIKPFRVPAGGWAFLENVVSYHE